MKCLYCGKEIEGPSVGGWHLSCVEEFFNSRRIPFYDAADDELDSAAESFIAGHSSIGGFQVKFCFGLSDGKDGPRTNIAFSGHAMEYLIKPENDYFPTIARCEYLVMQMAKAAGIKTPDIAIIKLKDRYAYIIKRMDRDRQGNKIHMEDFAQLSGVLSTAKYNATYEDCAKIIDRFSSHPLTDKRKLFYRIIFSFVTLNNDMHLKNFSMMEGDDVHLSPAYDLLPVSLIYPDFDDLALPLRGKFRRLTRQDFMAFGRSIGLDKDHLEKAMKRLFDLRGIFVSMIEDSLLDDDQKNAFVYMMNERFSRLTKRPHKPA